MDGLNGAAAPAALTAIAATVALAAMAGISQLLLPEGVADAQLTMAKRAAAIAAAAIGAATALKLPVAHVTRPSQTVADPAPTTHITEGAPTMTTTRPPRRAAGHGDPRPNVFAMAPTAVSIQDGSWQITHRGVTVGRMPTIHGDRLPFRALENACERVIAMELDISDQRARETAAAMPRRGDRVKQLIEQRRRINTRVLVRRALNMIDAHELVTLADAARAGDDRAVNAQLRKITGGALRRQQTIAAMASKTLELLGPDAIRDALTNRAGRRAQQHAPGLRALAA